ncbi:MAG TPA: diguanylate cyclase, partial [Fimbriimonadaceae bacterium]|nr:diguanylate cyclase [Fimbriimonadaceae bacterium]
MQTVEELKLLPVWVDPQHLVATAKHIMAGHKLKALGVVANGKLLGTVGLARLAPAADEQRVGEYMDPLVHVIQATTPVREVADLFVQENLEYAIAVRGDRFLGLVTPNMLLKELQRSYDPLTSLPWSDQLRDWGVEQLREGREITILFLDIDDFGLYNKKFGHIVGDRVLKNMAKALLETCDSEREIVVRYGGDEFAIGTLRDRVQAQELADSLAARLERVFVSEAEAPVGFCLGIQGGKRTHERENTHY